MSSSLFVDNLWIHLLTFVPLYCQELTLCQSSHCLSILRLITHAIIGEEFIYSLSFILLLCGRMV